MLADEAKKRAKLPARQAMHAFRELFGIDLTEMAKICKMSTELLQGVEEGWVTHPGFVKRIRAAYMLTARQAEELLPVHRRAHGGQCDPDKYVCQLNPGIGGFKR